MIVTDHAVLVAKVLHRKHVMSSNCLVAVPHCISLSLLTQIKSKLKAAQRLAKVTLGNAAAAAKVAVSL